MPTNVPLITPPLEMEKEACTTFNVIFKMIHALSGQTFSERGNWNDCRLFYNFLQRIDRNYFKNVMMPSFGQDGGFRSVQLKKIYLRMTAFVQDILNQDWSELPVPDLDKLVKGDIVQAELFGTLLLRLAMTQLSLRNEIDGIVATLSTSEQRQIRNILSNSCKVIVPPSLPFLEIPTKALEPQTLSKVETETEPETKIETKIEIETKIKTETETETEPEPETKIEIETKIKTETEPEPETKTEPEVLVPQVEKNADTHIDIEEYKALQVVYEAISDEADTLRDQLIESAKETKVSKTLIKDLEKRLTLLEQEKDLFQNSLDQTNTQTEELILEKTKLLTSNTNLESSIKVFLEGINQFGLTAKNLYMAIDVFGKIKFELNQFEEERAILKSKLANLQMAYSNQESSEDALSCKVEELTSDLIKVQQENEKAQIKLIKLEELSTVMQVQLCDKEEKLSTAINEKEHLVELLEKSKTDLQSTEESQTKQISELKDACCQSQASLQQAKEDQASIELEKVRREDEMQRDFENLQRLASKNLDRYKETIKALYKKLSSWKQQCKLSNLRVQELSIQRTKLKRQNKRLWKVLYKKSNDLSSTNLKAVALEDENQALMLFSKEQTNELELLQEQLALQCTRHSEALKQLESIKLALSESDEKLELLGREKSLAMDRLAAISEVKETELRLEISNLNSISKSFETELLQQRQRNNDHAKHLAELETENTALTNLQARQAELESHLDEFKNEIIEKDEILQMNEKELQKKLIEIEELQTELSRLNMDVQGSLDKIQAFISIDKNIVEPKLDSALDLVFTRFNITQEELESLKQSKIEMENWNGELGVARTALEDALEKVTLDKQGIEEKFVNLQSQYEQFVLKLSCSDQSSSQLISVMEEHNRCTLEFRDSMLTEIQRDSKAYLDEMIKIKSDLDMLIESNDQYLKQFSITKSQALEQLTNSLERVKVDFNDSSIETDREDVSENTKIKREVKGMIESIKKEHTSILNAWHSLGSRIYRDTFYSV